METAMENTELFCVQRMFRRDLILFNLEADSDLELLEKMSRYAYEKGMVKDTFSEAVAEREKHYPTGIPMPCIKIAIPHTDARHVIEPGILVAKLKRPVSFKGMGMEDTEVEASYVFLLLMDNDDHQVFLLQNMMNLCMNEKISERLLQAGSRDEIYDLIDYYYRTYAEY